MSSRQERVVQNTQDLIKIPSYSGHPEELVLQSKIINIFRDMQVPILRDGILNGEFVATKIEGGNKKRLFIIMSHPDVVRADDTQNWHHPPFEGVIENDMVYGRGAVDMKAGLAAGMEVLLRTQEDKNKGVEPPCNLMFVSTVEEETTGKGARAATGLLKREIDAHEQVAIVYTEPTGMTHVFYGHKGNIPVTATSTGETFHTSLVNKTPKKKHAAGNIARFTGKLEELNEVWKKNYGEDGPSIALTDFIGDSNSVHNQAASQSGVKFDVRTLQENHDSVPYLLEKLAGMFDVTINLHLATPPTISHADSELVGIVKSLHPSIMTGLFPAAADMGHVTAALTPEQQKKTQQVIFGPGFFELAHERNEHVPIEHILRITELYLETYKRFATS